jgi:dTDP-4-amino-4,6-dideoxygalactose transaminase
MRKFIHIGQPSFGKEEKKEVLAAMASGWVTLGPRTKQFEEDFAKFVGAKYAVAVSSCTAGIHLSLLAAGIGPGDEVITTPFTFVASANPIIHVGAKPVFVDIDPKTFNIDVNQIEKKITKKTKAIIPVHYAGLPVDLDIIQKLAKKYKLILIEDGAHAAGATYNKEKIGSIGDMTNFSFHPLKNMSTGDGGMVTTNDEKFAVALQKLRLHGMSRDAWKRHTATGSWRYDVEEPGYKYNMTDIQSALGLQQLKKLPQFIKVRKEYAKLYDNAFKQTPEITVPFITPGQKHIYSLYTIKIDTSKLKINRDEIVEELKKAHIGTNIQFIPLHYFSYYSKTFGYKKGDFPNAEKVFEEILSLPLYPKMKISEINYIAKTLNNLIKTNRK